MRPEGRAPYLHILRWLADESKWSLDLKDAIRKHNELKGSVGQIAVKGYLSDLIASDPDLPRVLHYNMGAKLLTVEDPQFAFYIRHLPWLQFARNVGFDQVEFVNRYDFALSFAGADRTIAESLFHELVEADSRSSMIRTNNIAFSPPTLRST